MGQPKDTNRLLSENRIVNTTENVTTRDRQKFILFMRDIIDSVNNPQDDGVNVFTDGDVNIVADAMVKSIYDVNNTGIVDASSAEVVVVKKGTPGMINRGDAVYITGSDEVELVDNTFLTDKGAGIALEDFTETVPGRVLVQGWIRDVDTSLLLIGPIWVGPVPGVLTQNPPVAGEKNQVAGYVTSIHPLTGDIAVSFSDIKNTDADFSIYNPGANVIITALNVQAALDQVEAALGGSGPLAFEVDDWLIDQDDWAFANINTALGVRIEMTAGKVDLTGIVAPAPPYNKVIYIMNADPTEELKIKSNNGGSAVANRFLCPEDKDYKIKKLGGCTAIYDIVGSKWMIMDRVKG